MTEESKQPIHQPRQRSTLRRVGTVVIFLLVAVVIGALVYAHTQFEAIAEASPEFDRSGLNLVTAMGVLLSLALVGSWIVFLSPLSLGTRLGIGLLGIVCVLGLIFSVEPINDGNVSMRGFRFRWQPAPDEELELPDVEEEVRVDFSNVNANLATFAASDDSASQASSRTFNQFLGNQRSGSVSKVQLVNDWEQSPPQELWQHPIGAAWSGFAAAHDFAVTMEQRGTEELTTCYDIETGEPVWYHAEETRHESPLGGIGPRATPTIHQGKVYAAGANGVLLCLDGADGSVVWRKDLFELLQTSLKEQNSLVTWGRAGSPMIYNDWVIVPGGGNSKENMASLIAFHKDTGAEVWRAGQDQISYASPLVANIGGKDHLVTLNESAIVAYDPETREELWRFERPGASNAGANTSQPVYLGDGRFLATKGYGLGAETFLVEQSEDGTYHADSLQSNRRVLKTKFTNCVVKDGFAYGLSDGILECVELKTLESKWKNGRYGHGQILLVDESILILTEEGEVVLVDASPEKLQERGRFSAFTGVTWNTLCLVGDKLLIRNAEFAACWKLPTIASDGQTDGVVGAKRAIVDLIR